MPEVEQFSSNLAHRRMPAAQSQPVRAAGGQHISPATRKVMDVFVQRLRKPAVFLAAAVTLTVGMICGPAWSLHTVHAASGFRKVVLKEVGTGRESNADAERIRIEFTAEAVGAASMLGPEATDEAILNDYADCLEGGDALVGRRLFYEKTEASCHRCHRTSDASPAGHIGPVTLLTSEIDERVTGLSPIPADIRKVFHRNEVRHVVAFLASLRDEATSPQPSCGFHSPAEISHAQHLDW